MKEEHGPDSELSKDTPYITFTGELWGVYCEEFVENWPNYNGTTLHIFMFPQNNSAISMA